MTHQLDIKMRCAGIDNGIVDITAILMEFFGAGVVDLPHILPQITILTAKATVVSGYGILGWLRNGG